jgi:EF hand
MKRFVAGIVATLLGLSAVMFWWQNRAESGKPLETPQALASSIEEEALPVGDDDAVGAPPPMPASAKPMDREARRFARYDRDRNGIITRTEMMSSRTKAFKKLDTDGNNLLSFEEWADRTGDRFEGADADHDGKLTPAEFATTAPKKSAKPECKC